MTTTTKRISENAKRKPMGAALKQESVTKSIQTALFHEWAKVGYAAVSVEAVAKKAGVGKAAIYRRWPTKLAMASDLLTEASSRVKSNPPKGDLESDIRALLGEFRRILRHPIISKILPDLHAEMARDSELATRIKEGLQQKRRASGVDFLKRAISRKQLPKNLDIEMALDLLGSMIYWRMIITHQKADQQYLDDLTSLLCKILPMCVTIS